MYAPCTHHVRRHPRRQGLRQERGDVDTRLMTRAENLASTDLSGWLDSVQTWRLTHS
jgi:hypothetical protein